MATDASSLAQLLDRQAIRDLVTRYACAVDRRDFDAVAACFTPDADTDYTFFQGPIAEALEKIADWRAEGYRIDDFFEFAFSCVTGLHQNYRLSLARSLEEAKEVEDAEQ